MLLGAQRESFEYFTLTFDGQIHSGIEAVRNLEDKIQKLREENTTDKEIEELIKSADQKEQIYNTQRVFYVMIKTITQKLSDENGFSSEERKSQMETMINFTEFVLLRVIIISMQFLNYKSSKLMRENEELLSVLEDLKLKINSY